MGSNQHLLSNNQTFEKRSLPEHVSSLRSADSSLRGYFLVSMPSSSDVWFGKSVVYVCEHSENGTLGLVINKSTQLSVADLFTKVDLQPPSNAMPSEFVLQGGPVHPERGLVLHDRLPSLRNDKSNPIKPSYKSSILVGDNTLEITSSRDVLEGISNGVGPSRTSIFLGHASWEAEQLEQEIANNFWLTTPANVNLIFETPLSKRYQAALALLGIAGLGAFVEQAGHG